MNKEVRPGVGQPDIFKSLADGSAARAANINNYRHETLKKGAIHFSSEVKIKPLEPKKKRLPRKLVTYGSAAVSLLAAACGNPTAAQVGQVENPSPTPAVTSTSEIKKLPNVGEGALVPTPATTEIAQPSPTSRIDTTPTSSRDSGKLNLTKEEKEAAITEINRISEEMKSFGLLELDSDSEIPAGKGKMNVGILKSRIWDLIGNRPKEEEPLQQGSNPPPAEGYFKVLENKIASGDLKEAWRLRQGIEGAFTSVGSRDNMYIPTADELEKYPGAWGAFTQVQGSSERIVHGIIDIDKWRKTYKDILEVFYKLNIPWRPEIPRLPVK